MKCVEVTTRLKCRMYEAAEELSAAKMEKTDGSNNASSGSSSSSYSNNNVENNDNNNNGKNNINYNDADIRNDSKKNGENNADSISDSGVPSPAFTEENLR